MREPSWDPIIERLEAKLPQVSVGEDGWVVVEALGYGPLHVRRDRWAAFAAAMPQMIPPPRHGKKLAGSGEVQ